ncbi:MAG TPA: SCO family protein [Gammaproteobacteria bacterium]|nr:SCO family protein [Gammaproteobacteria bacterium]
MQKTTFIVIAVVLAVAAAISGAWFAARLGAPPAPPEHARLLSTPRPVPAVPALDHRGADFGRADYEGRWTIVFFGFTHCPDICPTTLNVLAGARRLLDDLPEAARPAVTMISVDPGRDTPERLAEYVPFFHPEFRGVHVAAQHLPELARSFGAAYAYAPLEDENYTVDHTASVFLVDPEARVAGVFPTPHTAEGIATDMRRIMDLENRR